MPFIAKHKDGYRVDITQIDNPRAELTSGDIFCQNCGEPFIVVAGMIVSPHFRHYAECNGEWESHPESPEHLRAKAFLRDNLAVAFAEYTDAKLELEVPVPMEWRARGRIADVMATFPNGWGIAHEVQLASITVEALQERTEDYNRAGIDVIWWLGNRADTAVNRHWALDNQGYCFIITKEN
jgi:competence CoiA-like predicted nuclease